MHERFQLLLDKFHENQKAEKAAFGIFVPEQNEVERLLEDISERIKLPLQVDPKKNEKTEAQDIRFVAMERMSETKKRKSGDGSGEPNAKEPRSRQGTTEAFAFLEKKAEQEMAMREEELKIKKKEEETKAEQFQAIQDQQKAHFQVMTQ